MFRSLEAKPYNLFAQANAESLPHLALAAIDQRGDILGGGGPLVDDEVAVSHRDARATHPRSLESGAIDQRAG